MKTTTILDLLAGIVIQTDYDFLVCLPEHKTIKQVEPLYKDESQHDLVGFKIHFTDGLDRIYTPKDFFELEIHKTFGGIG